MTQIVVIFYTVCTYKKRLSERGRRRTSAGERVSRDRTTTRATRQSHARVPHTERTHALERICLPRRNPPSPFARRRAARYVDENRDRACLAETLSDVAKDGRRADGGASPDARRARDAGRMKPGRGLTNEILRFGLRDAQTAKPRSATTVRAQAVRVFASASVVMTLCVFTGWMVTTRCDAR